LVSNSTGEQAAEHISGIAYGQGRGGREQLLPGGAYQRAQNILTKNIL